MIKKPRGRPPVDNPASETIPRVRITPGQLKGYKEAANAREISLSDWIRQSLDKTAKRDLS